MNHVHVSHFPDKRSDTPQRKEAERQRKSSMRTTTDKENVNLAVLVPESTKVPFWKSHLSLHQDDRKILTGGQWLNTALIGAAYMLLKRKYSGIGGLQGTMLKQWVQNPLKSDQTFVQILHVGGNHCMVSGD